MILRIFANRHIYLVESVFTISIGSFCNWGHGKSVQEWFEMHV